MKLSYKMPFNNSNKFNFSEVQEIIEISLKINKTCIHASYRSAMCAFTFSRLNAFIYNRKKEINSEQTEFCFCFTWIIDFFCFSNNCFVIIFFLTPKSHKKSVLQTVYFNPTIRQRLPLRCRVLAG